MLKIVGYGQTADAYDMVAPDPEGKGATMAMKLALKDAGMKPTDVQYINSHGTSTGLGDIAESQAIARVFGDLNTNKILTCQFNKKYAWTYVRRNGSVEGIACIKTINEGIVPPT